EKGHAAERQTAALDVGERSVRRRAAERESGGDWGVHVQPAVPGAGLRQHRRAELQLLPRLRRGNWTICRERSDRAWRRREHVRLRRWKSGFAGRSGGSDGIRRRRAREPRRERCVASRKGAAISLASLDL